MNGFLFLTISLLVMLQIQSGVLENVSTPAAGNSTAAVPKIPKTPMNPLPTPVITTMSTTTTTTTIMHPPSTGMTRTILTTKMKPPKGEAPALRNVGVGSFFLFLTNYILIHLPYLS